MPFYSDDRMALFIDGANLHKSVRALDFDVDFKKVLEEFRGRSKLVRAYYYTALREDQEYSPLRPLVDFLSYNGYTLITKTVKRYTDEATGAVRMKGNMDIEIAVDMMQLAPNLDHVVLFSGDGDFRRLVEAVQRQGVRVTVVSALRTSPPMVSDDLRRQADAFIDLEDMAEVIGRPRLAPRPGYGQDRDRYSRDDHVDADEA